MTYPCGDCIHYRFLDASCGNRNSPYYSQSGEPARCSFFESAIPEEDECQSCDSDFRCYEYTYSDGTRIIVRLASLFGKDLFNVAMDASHQMVSIKCRTGHALHCRQIIDGTFCKNLSKFTFDFVGILVAITIDDNPPLRVVTLEPITEEL